MEALINTIVILSFGFVLLHGFNIILNGIFGQNASVKDAIKKFKPNLVTVKNESFGILKSIVK